MFRIWFCSWRYHDSKNFIVMCFPLENRLNFCNYGCKTNRCFIRPIHLPVQLFFFLLDVRSKLLCLNLNDWSHLSNTGYDMFLKSCVASLTLKTKLQIMWPKHFQRDMWEVLELHSVVLFSESSELHNVSHFPPELTTVINRRLWFSI